MCLSLALCEALLLVDDSVWEDECPGRTGCVAEVGIMLYGYDCASAIDCTDVAVMYLAVGLSSPSGATRSAP